MIEIDREIIEKYSISHAEYFENLLQDPQRQELYLQVAFEDYQEDHDFGELVRCVEQVKKIRENSACLAAV